MHRLQFHYTLSRDSSPALVRNPLIDLLQAVSSQGSISGGARALGLSYRHVWGALKRWEDELGNELVVWEKGQSARLTEFGAKLLWAERQAQARLAPQIEALRSDLERVFAVAFDENAHVVTLYASHDDALTALLQPGLHKIIGFAERTQGLMVAPGNPLNLRSLADLASGAARFVNRTLGTGTRVVLDELLAQQGVPAGAIRGYDEVEPSHTAAAHAVASGAADAALGIEIAARALGLDFVPLVQESYHLVCLKSALEEPAIAALLALLQSPRWQQRLAAMAGYTPHHSGEVESMRKVLPWWDFARHKKA